jgi:hypothetical protein
MDDHPIENKLREIAQILGLPIPPRLPYMTTTEAWLLQAQIIEELAKRVMALGSQLK